MNHFRAWSACALLGALTLAACGSDDDTSAVEVTIAATPTINVIAGSSAVDQVVAEIYAKALEDAGFRVGRKDAVADEAAAYDAVAAGTAQLTVVHSGALLASLDPDGTATEAAVASTTTTSTTTSTTEVTDDTATDDTATDDTATDDTATDDTATDDTGVEDTTTTTTIEQRYPIQVETAALDAVLPDGVITGGPSFADDRAVIACTADVVGDGAVASISELADVDGGIRLGGPAAFETATLFGLDQLDSIYGVTPTSFAALTPAEAGTAIEDGEVDCLVATETAPVVLQQSLLILTDDQGAIPADFVLPVLTTSAGTPDVLTTIDAVNAQLSTEILRSLIVKVEVDGSSPDEAASAFFAATSSG